MTQAGVKAVRADRVGAREFVTQARIFVNDAASPGLANESRQLLLHQASLTACDAVLLAAGWTVGSGDGAHALRLDKALAELPGADDELFDRLDASRARRNEASYRAQAVPTASVSEATEATLELLALVDAFLEQR